MVIFFQYTTEYIRTSIYKIFRLDINIFLSHLKHRSVPFFSSPQKRDCFQTAMEQSFQLITARTVAQSSSPSPVMGTQGKLTAPLSGRGSLSAMPSSISWRKDKGWEPYRLTYRVT